MAKQTDTHIRASLLQKSLDVCVHQGFKGLSLRSIAQEIGTSHRMLIYHFGSSEAFFQAIVEEFRRRLITSFEDDFSRVASSADFVETVTKLWRRLVAAENRFVLLSSFEIQLDALRQGETRENSSYLSSTLEDWLEPVTLALIRLGHKPDRSRLKARTLIGAGRGLILDILAAPNDSDRAEAVSTFEHLVERLVPGEAQQGAVAP